MLLAIDIGNTSIGFGVFCYDNNSLVKKWQLISDSKKNASAYSIDIIESLLNNSIDHTKVSVVVISSVVPILTKIIELAIRKFYSNNILVIGRDIKLNIDISLPDPEEVGCDRLINAVIGYKKFGGDLIIVDFGTATTFDVVGSKGEYLGGVITPGVNLSIETLHNMTAKLPMIKVKKQENVIGKSTKDAINSGIYFGYISLVEGLIEKISCECNKQMKVISTGGLSSLFKEAVKDIKIEEDLILEGICFAYKASL